jgi:hypothetical protein
MEKCLPASNPSGDCGKPLRNGECLDDHTAERLGKIAGHDHWKNLFKQQNIHYEL